MIKNTYKEINVTNTSYGNEIYGLINYFNRRIKYYNTVHKIKMKCVGSIQTG